MYLAMHLNQIARNSSERLFEASKTYRLNRPWKTEKFDSVCSGDWWNRNPLANTDPSCVKVYGIKSDLDVPQKKIKQVSCPFRIKLVACVLWTAAALLTTLRILGVCTFPALAAYVLSSNAVYRLSVLPTKLELQYSIVQRTKIIKYNYASIEGPKL